MAAAVSDVGLSIKAKVYVEHAWEIWRLGNMGERERGKCDTSSACQVKLVVADCKCSETLAANILKANGRDVEKAKVLVGQGSSGVHVG
eukprot:286045-Amorphochlora_amoeboformis.AAC.3